METVSFSEAPSLEKQVVRTCLPEPFGEPVARQQTGLVVTLEAAYNGEGHFAGKEGQAGFVVELEAWGTILRKRKIMPWYKLLTF